MVACVLIPGFELRAALRARPSLALRPAALAPAEGEEPLLGPVTAAAEAKGVKPGMRMGEALATCPELVLVEQDPSAAEQAWEEILRSARGLGLRGRVGRPRLCLLRDARGRASLRRRCGCARARPRCRRFCLGSTRWRGRAPVCRSCGGERRASRAGLDRCRRAHARFPRASAASRCFPSLRSGDASSRSSACAMSESLLGCRAAP